MGEQAAIKVQGLGKRYRIGTVRKAHQVLAERLSGLFGRRSSDGDDDGRTIWALKDVSFEVGQGEVLGVIGRNGAGKSTLLKILSRITSPTEGTAEINGRVGSLLEVGTGFHPELTGRENVFLNGAILGMSRQEIRRSFDEIAAFAEIDKFIDTPVKRYSSGMYVRLGFAVAAHFAPEVLLVDEVLAVGDAAFQRKCLGRMGDVAGQGRTVLFISHNMTAVQSICGRVIHINEGRIIADGPPHEVVHGYLDAGSASCTERRWDDPAEAPGSDKVKLLGARVRPTGGTLSDNMDIDTDLTVEFEFLNMAPDSLLHMSVHLHNDVGALVFNTAPTDSNNWHGKPMPAGLFRSGFTIPGGILNDGLHRVLLFVVQDHTRILSKHEDVLVFEVRDVIERRGEFHGKWPGAVRPDLTWTTELVRRTGDAEP